MSTASSVVPVQTRDERFRSAHTQDFPVVTGREYEWHLTPIDRVRPFFDGGLSDDIRPHDVSSVGPVAVSYSAMSQPPVGSVGLPEDRASAAAWSSTSQVRVIHIGADDVSNVVIREVAQDNTSASAHTVIQVDAFAKTTIFFECLGHAQLSENVEIIAGESSHVTIVYLLKWDQNSVHLSSHFISVGKDAHVTHALVNVSHGLARINPRADLIGEGSSVNLLGLYVVGPRDHVEHQVFVNHVAPHTTSRVTYKGALHGEQARSVWIGDVLIGQGAIGTDSYEQNRNLLLTPGARADSIPNLEIKTGDISGAGHASASGRLDDEQLFYLQARGISEHEAKQLVVRGFLSAVVQEIESNEIRDRLNVALDGALQDVI